MAVELAFLELVSIASTDTYLASRISIPLSLSPGVMRTASPTTEASCDAQCVDDDGNKSDHEPRIPIHALLLLSWMTLLVSVFPFHEVPAAAIIVAREREMHQVREPVYRTMEKPSRTKFVLMPGLCSVVLASEMWWRRYSMLTATPSPMK